MHGPDAGGAGALGEWDEEVAHLRGEVRGVLGSRQEQEQEQASCPLQQPPQSPSPPPTAAAAADVRRLTWRWFVLVDMMEASTGCGHDLSICGVIHS